MCRGKSGGGGGGGRRRRRRGAGDRAISGVIGCCMDVKLLAYELGMHKLKCFVDGRLGEARGHTNGGKNKGEGLQ